MANGNNKERREKLVHSHAFEEDIPGTVNLNAQEGDNTGYGQALFPIPAEDPNDPLQWSNAKKTLILVTVVLYSFLGSSALLGPSVYIPVFMQAFQVGASKASDLISYPNLVYGFGSLILVPLYFKIGRRPVMLLSMVIYLVGLIACTQAKNYGGFMAARIVASFGSGVCESLPTQLVNDIFFLHERGERLVYYTVALCLGATAPLYAGYMLNAGLSYKTFFWVVFAFSAALFVLAFFIVEETAYDRKLPSETLPHTPSTPETEGIDDKNPQTAVTTASTEASASIPPRKSFKEQLRLFNKVDHESPFFLMMIRSFTYFLVPQVFWVVTTYGLYIGLGGLTFNYTFPLKIMAPPYLWSNAKSGLIAIATILGYGIALPLSQSSDRLAAYYTKKNNGIREAEMRLGVMLPAMLIAPAGLVVYGFACQKTLHWVTYFVGVVMDQFGAFFYFSFTLAYALDSYNANIAEMLIAMNLGKQAISFGMGFGVLDWILKTGYAAVIAGAFGGVLLANNLVLLIFMLWGKKIRVAMSKTGLAKMHKKSIREPGMSA